MKKTYKCFLIFLAVFLMLEVIDVALSGIFKTYFTIIFFSFCIVKTDDYGSALYFAVFGGIANDIIFSKYLGPFSLTFLIAFGIYKLVKTYFPINHILSFFLICVIAVLCITIRSGFYTFVKFELYTTIFSALAYPVMNITFKKFSNIKREVYE